ncbi:MAG TPA: fused MFS/spermidine synthase [Gemmatimonadaceae bacterium]|nr:fused MFS/spermidine synthase [Gemmatimonadaceae bacterium]
MTVLFIAAIFLNSALLFWLEPLFGKTVLPLLGGTPAVWNACILFYQTALLAGYAWAHAADKIGIRRHALMHLALALAALAFMPFAVARSLLPPPSDRPLGWLLMVLVSSVGLPFVVVAANGPLLQRWYSRSGAKGARDPYFLYAASNLGSFASLLLFPVVLEPNLTLSQQGRGWRVVYVITLLFAGAAALVLRRMPARLAPDPTPAANDIIPIRRKLYWVSLSAIPSSLMLGVTTYIAAEVASIPLVWIVPLALYLATLVAAYGATDKLRRALDGVFARELSARAAIATIGTLALFAVPCAIVYVEWGARGAVVVAHLMLFTIAALICHVQLAADRPSAAHLTNYYLWSAAGGALGGAFNTLIGPALFTSVLEYPIALTAVLTVLPARGSKRPSAAWSDVAWAVVIGVATTAIALVLRWSHAELPFSPRLLLGVPALACLGFSGRPLRFGGGLVAVVLASAAFPSEIGNVQYASRNFFGVHRVLLDERHGFRWLTHGVTIHGGERLRDSLSPKPLTYYTPVGPVGDIFRAYGMSRPNMRIGVIGLGAGAMLFYGRRDQDWTFYEIDPGVTEIAENPRYFGFLARSRSKYRVVAGDARLSMQTETGAPYDMLVLDAFSSDAIPTHLLTREALRLYLSRLAPGGLLVMHISNRFFDLSPVVARLASDARLAGAIRVDGLPDDLEDTGVFGSRWAVLARDPSQLAPLAALGWQPLVSGGRLRVWTDDYSSVLPLLRRGAP